MAKMPFSHLMHASIQLSHKQPTNARIWPSGDASVRPDPMPRPSSLNPRSERIAMQKKEKVKAMPADEEEKRKDHAAYASIREEQFAKELLAEYRKWVAEGRPRKR